MEMTTTGIMGVFRKNRDMMITIFLIMIIGVLIIPISPWMLDMFLSLSLTLSALTMMTVLYVKYPLQMSVYPSLLLVLTLFRLTLNVASTRLILGGATTAIPEEKAGKVVMVFGQFVAQNNEVVGIVVFAILVIINFVVITKGTTRISEVAARFTLDAMPGKQMAIDADLNAGLIDEVEARTRRAKIARETDFYGAMDGASKFVRGDAIAGIIITLINIIGGFVIGMAMEGMTAQGALSFYTRLTIGDGLVSQIPALIISVSAAMLVTRSASESSLGGDVMGQLFANPKALGASAVLLALLGLTGLPKVPMFLLAGFCTWAAISTSNKKKHEKAQKIRAEKEEKTHAPKEPERVESLLKVDQMELEVGYGLIPLVDSSQGGDLLDRITMIRRQVALELGVIVPPIRIRDNMQLEPNDYIVKIRGNEVGRGVVYCGRYLAMDSGLASGPVEGIQTTEPAFGLTAYWVTDAHRDHADALGYTVVDATSVVATHLTEIIKNYGYLLLTREETSKLIDNLKESAGKLVEEVVGKVLSIGEIQAVLQYLLRERVSIRDMETILETLGDVGPRLKDTIYLTEYVRSSLQRQICQSLVEDDGKLYVTTMDPQLENIIKSGVKSSDSGSYVVIPPDIQQRIVEAIAGGVERMISEGHQGILLTAPQVRPFVKQITERAMRALVVLSTNEVTAPGTEVESVGMVVLEKTPPV